MNWKIKVKPTAEKKYLRLDKRTRKRIKKALQELEKAKNSLLHQNVRLLTGKLQVDYRLRLGDWKFLFTPEKEKKIIHIYAILPRGGSYN